MKSEIKTPRGTFKIEREFSSKAEAEENGYGLYFTNDDGTDIYTYHIDKHHCKFAIITKKKEMNKYYYTFGTNYGFPYQNGWVEVMAPSMSAAHKIFRIYFPDRTEGVLNCADYYTEEEFKESKISKTGNKGSFCHAIIGIIEKQKPIKPTIHTDCITCGSCWTEIKRDWKCCPVCLELIDWAE